MRAVIVGIGKISDIYLKNLTTTDSGITVVGLFDRHPERSAHAAEKYGIKRTYATFEDVLLDASVELVINLTQPASHYSLSKKALLAGKHVYTEKPLAETFEQAVELAALAAAKKKYIAGAPDTFLGAGLQTCQNWIACGNLGQVIGGKGFFLCHGHEHWHPNPAFYYQKGAGPVMDMGPYYLTALVQLLGPVKSVYAVGQITFPQRTISCGERKGQQIPVETPTHVSTLLEFASGVGVTLTCSFDVWYDQGSHLEIFGTNGTLRCPDPNTFGGDVQWFDQNTKQWHSLTPVSNRCENLRGLGVTEMVEAISKGIEPRAGISKLLHVQEIMEGITHSLETHQPYSLTTSTEPVALLP